MLRSVFKLARVSTKASTQLNASKLAGLRNNKLKALKKILRLSDYYLIKESNQSF